MANESYGSTTSQSEEIDEEADEGKDLSGLKTDEAAFKKWWRELSSVMDSKSQKAFEKNGEKIVKNYRNADSLEDRKIESGTTRVMYNVLWSNVQIQKPLLYARMPKIVVERRFKDSDPIGRVASEIAERGVSYILDCYEDEFNFSVKSAVEDRLLPGRGQVWLRYEANFEDVQEEVDEGEEVATTTKQISKYSEKVCIDYVFWQDYFHSPSRNPFEDRWRARRTYMNKEKLKKRFPDCYDKINFKTDKRKKFSEEEDYMCEVEVFEVEDKENKRRLWISDAYPYGLLDIKEDVLKLSNFFSTPTPLLATTTTDSSYPTPDFKIYERLANEADDVTKRISSLVECIRMVGVHAASFSEDMKNILDLSDGQSWPSKVWSQFQEAGGFKGMIDWYPFERAVEAIQPLTAYREDLINKIDLITGIPDFARGSTEAHETAEAQQRKAHWIAIKAEEKQKDVQRFCREIIEKIGEIMFEPGLFSDETLYLMCGVQQMSPEDQELFPPALALLRDDEMRTFRIDIETDSTIAVDEVETAEKWMEYMRAQNELMGNINQVVQFRPELLHPIIETARQAARSLRTGRPVEGAWDKAMQEIEQKTMEEAQNPQQPPPDAALLQAQAYMTDVQQKFQIAQLEASTKNADTQQAAMEARMKYDIEMDKLGLEGQKAFSKDEMSKMEHDSEIFKQQFTQMLEAQKLEAEKYKIALGEREKLLEEERLKSEQSFEMVRHIQEVQNSPPQAPQPSVSQAPPVIHIHNKDRDPTIVTEGNEKEIVKEITMKRNSDGSLVGRSVQRLGGNVNGG